MKYASVCSGVEAASLAWIPLGWEAAWFSEIEPFPCAVLKERFPTVPNLGDMTKIKVMKEENGQRFYGGDGDSVFVPGGIDLLVGGTPCQSFSVAGKREGLEGASGLAKSFVELLGAMRPRWFVWENVPGCLSSLNKRTGVYDFNFLLAAFAERGYSLCWRILDAQFTRVDGYPRAVPQRRRRVFVVGYSSGDWRYPASVLFEPDSLLGNNPPCRVKGKGFTGNLANSVGTASTIRMRAGKPGGGKGALVSDELSLTLAAAGNDQTLVNIGYRSSRPGQFVEDAVRGTLKLNSASAGNSSTTLVCDEVASTLNAHYGDKMGLENQHVNAGCPLFVIHGAQESISQYGKIAGTLEARHDSSPCADRGQNIVLCYENHAQDSRITESRKGVSPQLNAKAGTGGNNLPLVQEIKCYDVCRRDVTPKETKEVSPTLTRGPQGGNNNLPLVQTFTKTAHPQNPEQGQGFAETDTAKTLSVHTSPASEIRAEELVAGVMGAANSATVRRLLPIECERLMGFPDNWTMIPWKGKPAEDCPDSPRYKACGNSMCVNVMRWIGKRIELVEKGEIYERDTK